MRWKTDEVLKLLDGLCDLKTEEPGGDYDTTVILASQGGGHRRPGGYSLWISGFHPLQEMVNPDDAEIEMIEVSDGGDSRGGCNATEEEDLILHARVVSRLRKAGYLVVPRMKDYF